jgi:LL-diaminopimelate aminotransferase
MPSPAARLNNLPPYPFAALNQRVRELNAAGHDVINIDVGNPDMPPPEAVISALTESAGKPGVHGYSGYKGTPSFRAAISRYYARRFGITPDPETQVMPLLGSKEGIVNLTLAYLDQGDSALIPEISYPAYNLGTILAGGTTIYVPVDAANGFAMSIDALRAALTPACKLVWINFPNNPTGGVVDLEYLTQIVDFCKENGLLLASDNPYVDVTFEGYRAHSILEVPGAIDTAVEFISFSKTYNMAGWRLGAAVGNAEAIRNLLTVKSNMDSGHFQPIYDAGIVAIDSTPQAWLDERNAIYQRRRDLILAALSEIGLRAEKPLGSLYIWARVLDGDGMWYAEHALMQANVSLAPGGIYGPGGSQYVRMSVAVPDARLQEALQRLKDWYAQRR